jgi:hypothetical protein
VNVNGGLFGGHVTSSPAGIDCSGGGCTATYAGGTVVTLTASPSALQSVSWSGCDTADGNTCTVTMAAARQVTATFSP